MSRDDAVEYAICIECSCGETFEPKKIVVDKYGEKCAVCPKCQKQIRLEVQD